MTSGVGVVVGGIGVFVWTIIIPVGVGVSVGVKGLIVAVGESEVGIVGVTVVKIILFGVAIYSPLVTFSEATVMV